MSDQWIKCKDQLPPKETPVLILYNNTIRIGEIRTDYPGYEDSYAEYDYWDDPNDDGQDWQWDEVSHWMHLPKEPN